MRGARERLRRNSREEVPPPSSPPVEEKGLIVDWNASIGSFVVENGRVRVSAVVEGITTTKMFEIPEGINQLKFILKG